MRPLRSSPRAATPTSRLAPWGWAVWGCAVGAVLATVAFAPAQWLAQGLARATDGRVQLAQARGTVWSGSAALVLTGGQDSQDRTALPGRVDWKLQPGWGSMRLRLQADCCTPAPLDLRIQPQWGGMSLHVADGLSQWPAQPLQGLGTPWNTLEPQGQLNLQTRQLTLQWVAGRLRVNGTAQLQARAMSSRLSTLRPMGSYQLTLTGGETTALTLTTLEGALVLHGQGQWVGQRLRFQGEAYAAPDQEAALSNLLNIIGRRSGARSLITVG